MKNESSESKKTSYYNLNHMAAEIQIKNWKIKLRNSPKCRVKHSEKMREKRVLADQSRRSNV